NGRCAGGAGCRRSACGRRRAPPPGRLTCREKRGSMKTPAAIYVEAGKPMVIDDHDLPDPGPTQVLVRHFATGVCHSQLHELNRPNPSLPLVLGHEATGIVNAVGAQVSHVKEGDHVMVTWVQRGATRGTPRP